MFSFLNTFLKIITKRKTSGTKAKILEKEIPTKLLNFNYKSKVLKYLSNLTDESIYLSSYLSIYLNCTASDILQNLKFIFSLVV